MFEPNAGTHRMISQCHKLQAVIGNEKVIMNLKKRAPKGHS
jgi:hypothetical protein